MAIHGGVGTIPKQAMTAAASTSYREALTAALQAGFDALRKEGTAMDAVVAAVRVMEDSPLFNAGRGSNFDERGVITMDASVMDGSTLEAGAVAGVTDVRHPAELARLVMERSEHVLLIGEGAERFARLHGIGSTAPDYFHTDRRWDALQRAKAMGSARPNVLGDGAATGPPSATDQRGKPDPEGNSGTVGAVAKDARGRLAAATSTGGMANKTWGRVGDSPIIGAGTYASRACAVSCTGWGEYFMRNAAAYDVHARMIHGGASLSRAVEGVVFDTLERQVPRSGGIIAVDADGHVELAFNTPGMYRGHVGGEGRFDVRIYE
ncbi:MAG: isoaspartyl peptidase/L-asparaginase [Longimicrobiales bacterium]|nr:isoaspartyl peptidase/L-asparaginase [Longimicrobiales bacterium]